MRARMLFFFKQKTAYEVGQWLEFRRVLFRSKGMMELDISSLRSVQVDWRQQGSLLSEWTEEIPLNEGGGTNFGSAGLSGMDEPMNAPPPIDDGDLPGDEAMSLEDVYANEMADNDFGASNDFADSIDGDESMDDMQEDRKSVV